MLQLSTERPKAQDSWYDMVEHIPRDDKDQEYVLPKVHVRRVIMKYSAADVQNVGPATTSKAASHATATDKEVNKCPTDYYAVAKSSQNSVTSVQPRKEKNASDTITGDANFVELRQIKSRRTNQQTISDNEEVDKGRTDYYAVAKSSQNSAACVQPRKEENASDIITGDANRVELHQIESRQANKRTMSENLNIVGSKSGSGNGDGGAGSWCDSSGNMSRWNTKTRLFQIGDDGRLVKSEGQTPVSTDDRCRVSRKSSLDQLRLRFQHQKRNAGRYRAELDHLKRKIIDAQHELDKERNGRRKLEEWTDYLESQLEKYISSRTVVEKQYAFFHFEILGRRNASGCQAGR